LRTEDEHQILFIKNKNKNKNQLSFLMRPKSGSQVPDVFDVAISLLLG
jgi:hypothetical protein